MLLGEEKFKAETDWGAVTHECQSETKKFVTIDTPGACESEGRKEKKPLIEEMKACMKLGTPGLHAVIVVISLKGTFNDEDMRCLEEYSKIFGDKFFNYAILLFTHCDLIEEDNGLLTEKLNKAPEKLKTFIHRCGCRFTTFNNKSEDECKRQEQVRSLLTLIDNSQFRNGNKRLTLGDLEKAELKQDDKSENGGDVSDETIATKQEIKTLQTKIRELEEDIKHQKAKRKSKSEKYNRLKAEMKQVKKNE